MKPFKVVWLKTETLEAELDHIKGIDDIKKFMSDISPDSVINSVEGSYAIFRWNGKEYVPYSF